MIKAKPVVETESIFQFASTVWIVVDFSDTTEPALYMGFRLARAMGASVKLTHIVKPPYEFSGRKESQLEAGKEGALHTLSVIREDYAAREPYQHIPIELHLEEGATVATVLSLVKSDPTSLLVLGFDVDEPGPKGLFGNITNQLIVESPVPVIAISSNETSTSWDHVVYATDFREQDRVLLKRAKTFANALGADFECIHIKVPKDDIHELHKSRMTLESELNYEISVQLISSQDFLDGVEGYLVGKPNTLLILSRNRLSFFEWLLAKPVAAEFARVQKIPLMMIPSSVQTTEAE